MDKCGLVMCVCVKREWAQGSLAPPGGSGLAIGYNPIGLRVCPLPIAQDVRDFLSPSTVIPPPLL